MIIEVLYPFIFVVIRNTLILKQWKKCKSWTSREKRGEL